MKFKMFNFGSHLKKLRIQNNLTQKELAEKIDISERAIQNYELNSRKPNFDMLIKLSRFFNVSIDYLVGESDNPRRTDNPEVNK